MPRGTKRKLETPPTDEKPPKKIKLDLKHDAREENQLPDELVLQLFRLIERAEVVQCSMVCRQWYRIGQREEFHWTLVTSFLITEDSRAYHFQRNKKLKHYASLSLDETIEELKLWHSDPLHSGKPVRVEGRPEGYMQVLYLYDEEDNVVAISSVGLSYFDFSKKNNDLLWKYTVELARQKVEGEERSWLITLFINLKALDSMVLEKNSKIIPNADALLQVIYDERTESSIMSALSAFAKFVNRPLKSTVPQKQPDGFRDDIKLFKYQLDAITWMKSVENQIGLDVIYTSAVHWKGSAIYFDVLNQKIVHPRNIGKHIHKEKIRGGILADEVGLGKTFEVLGLILAAPPQTEPEPHPVLLTSKSTLIMCPEHLCQQWHDEITRATTLSALVVRNYDELKQCTYEDFMTQYDVIVCPYELLSTLNYVCLPSRRTKGTLTEKERNINVKKALEDLKTNKNFSEVKAPIIEHFFFHRVVFDEGHQSRKHFNLKSGSIALSKNVWGCRKWFVSATPFGNRTSSNEIFRFLCLPDVKPELQEYRDELIYRDYFWRNTKESVKDELIVPETVDDVHYVELSPIERAIYFVESYHSNRPPYNSCCTFTYDRGLKVVAENSLQNLQMRIEWNRTSAQTADGALQAARQLQATDQNQSEAKKRANALELETLTKESMYWQRVVNTEQNAIEILEQEIPKLPEKLVQAKTKTEREFIGIQQRYGTKVAGMLVYLKKLLTEKPESRVIIFSMGRYNYLEMLLNENGIMATSVQGDVYNKVRAIEDFKKEMAPFKVIMMNSQENSAGTNMIEATHVLLLDPPAHNQESFETQAIGRAYRQGQTKQITVVRILFKDTIEHENYLKRNNMPLDELITYDPQTWKPHHDHEKDATNTNPVRIAKLGKSSSFSGISVSDLKQSLELQNNTNERKEDDTQKETESNNGTEQVGDESEHNEPQNKKPAPKKKAVKKKAKN